MTKHTFPFADEISTPTLEGLGGCKSTVGAGLPTFASRNDGDLHYDDVAGKEYVLTGVAGEAVADNFDARADNSALTSGTTPTGGKTWSDGGGQGLQVVGGTAVVITPNTGYAFVDTGVPGARNISFDYKTSVSQQSFEATAAIFDIASTGSQNFLYVSITRDLIQILKGVAGTNTVLATYGRPVTVAGGTVLSYAIDMDPVNGTVNVYEGGVLMLTATTSLPAEFATYSVVGIRLDGTSTTDSYLDNFSTTALGSLAWNLTESPLEQVNAVADSGAAQTIPDPSLGEASVSRIVLSANCTLTFPTPQAGMSFTLELVQDATGGWTTTWPVSVRWPGATAPTQTTTANHSDFYSFLCTDGSSFAGFQAGADFGG